MLTATTIPAIPDITEATHGEAKEFFFFEAHALYPGQADGNEITGCDSKRYSKMNAVASTVAEIRRKSRAETKPLHCGNRQNTIGFKSEASALSNRIK